MWDILTLQTPSITCVCDPQGTIFNCFPTNYKLRNDISDSSSQNIKKSQMEQDEEVEIILASTALVAVIALFLR